VKIRCQAIFFLLTKATSPHYAVEMHARRQHHKAVSIRGAAALEQGSVDKSAPEILYIDKSVREAQTAKPRRLLSKTSLKNRFSNAPALKRIVQKYRKNVLQHRL
jgi:hypothetical protein